MNQLDKSIEIKKIYYLLIGNEKSIKNTKMLVKQSIVDVINKNIKKLEELIDVDLSDYIIDYNLRWSSEGGNNYREDTILFQLQPVLSLLENMYINSSEYQIAKVGYIYNSIEDTELHNRCGDILLGEHAYDRAINQATQILENRIKEKAGLSDSGLIGLNLVSKAIHPKLENTILKFSDKSDIQEGYANLFKGLVSVYRNPTHHSFDFDFTREYALKVVAYIDELLKILDKSEKV